MNTVAAYAAVLFDCDSTLSAIEGIDELARQAGLYEQLAPLTAAAMEGRISLEAVYRQRLEAIRPTREQVVRLAEDYVRRQVSDARETVAALHGRGLQVHIVSGGLRPAILPLAASLGIAAERVRAVDVLFDAQGRYRDFDAASPLARGGGKTVVCRDIQAHVGRVVLVGDGMTDWEVSEAGFSFIGFGGVVRRPAVRERAGQFLEGPGLSGLLEMLPV